MIAKPIDERILYSKIVGLVKKPLIVKSIVAEEGENTQNERMKCIDLTYLTNRTKSNPDLMLEMISLYLEQTPPLIQAMKQSFHDQNWPLLYATVHKMIPSFSIVGISPDVENMAKKIQHYASAQEQADGINDLVLHLENICGQACKELQEASI